MSEPFPTTPRASRNVRLGAILIGLAAVILATWTTITSTAWVGRVFPGFVVLHNRVIASSGLAGWSGTAVPDLYQSEIVAVDGEPVRSSAEVYARAAAGPPGTEVRYRLRRHGREREVTVATQRFTVRDWFLLFGAFLLNGAAFLASGLIAWVLRPTAPVSRALLAIGVAWAVFMFTAMDLYDPSTFFRLHIAGETFTSAATWHLMLLFPQPHRYARWRLASYVPALAILVVYELFLYTPAVYSTILGINMICLASISICLGARLVVEYWRGESQLARQRVRVVMLGTLLGFALPATVVLGSVLRGRGFTMNLGAVTPVLFSLSIAYAVVKHDFFAIDAMVKRGAYYLVTTGAVLVTYAAAVALLNMVFRAGELTDSAAFPVLFALAVLAILNPLRTRLQAIVDRVFFRTGYDAAAVLGAVGGQLASTLERERIATLVKEAVGTAIPGVRTRLFAGGHEVGGSAALPPALVAPAREGRVLTAFDAAELYPDAAVHEGVRAAMTELGAEVAVPLHLRGELVGALSVGPKRSGLFYTAGDAEFLRALTHQAAIALENASTYEALAALNAGLEERVRERTAALAAANRELGTAYAELKTAEGQLVQAEKMAALGRMVAGVAHEIDAPVSFIARNVVPLRRQLVEAVAAAPPAAARELGEAAEIVEVMGRGAERTAAIVRGLRSFSRLGEGARQPVDVQAELEVSVRLLEPRWRGRIEVHRDYGELPAVLADPGQLSQVLMNVLANACDAIGERGNIWLTTRSAGETVAVTVRDDGAGIPADLVGRIFDPFFTTKAVGSGMGLGLAITHGLVTAHGGRIAVESTPGAGTTFRITLPVNPALEVARAAGGG